MLTTYGAIVVTLMMIFYAFESRSHWFTFAFALACLGSAAYGWLAGTWPFGMVETVWAIVAFRKWYRIRLGNGRGEDPHTKLGNLDDSI